MSSLFDWFTTSPVLTIGLALGVVYNFVVFLIYGSDKTAALRGRRRTPEKTLLLLALLGGTPGALIAISWFRHKSRKAGFQFWLALIGLLQAVCLYSVLFVL